MRWLYEEHGYIRVKMDNRLGGKRTGWEIRLSLPTRKEAEGVRGSLRKLRLKAGRLFAKHDRYVVPLYGRRQVESFLRIIRPNTKNHIPK